MVAFWIVLGISSSILSILSSVQGFFILPRHHNDYLHATKQKRRRNEITAIRRNGYHSDSQHQLFVLSAHIRKNRYYYQSSSSARNNSNMTEFETIGGGSKAMIFDQSLILPPLTASFAASTSKAGENSIQSSTIDDDKDDINNTSEGNDSSNNNDATICRIVASADYKIPPLVVSPNSSSSLLWNQIDAISHAKTRATTQSQIKYMETIQKAYRIMNDSSSSSSISSGTSDESNQSIYENLVYNPTEEGKLVQTLKQSLENSGFQLLTKRDVELCEALNAGYLLRLSILPDNSGLDPTIGKEFYPELYTTSTSSSSGDIDNEDNKDYATKRKVSSAGKTMNIEKQEQQQQKEQQNNGLLFDGRILVYRRGYSEEVTRDRLLLPKFDYLQSSLVQRTASNFSKKLGELERNILDQIMELCHDIVSRIIQSLPPRLQKMIKPIDGDEINEINVKSKGAGKNVVRLGRYRSGKFIDSPDNSNDDALSPFLVCEIADTSNTKFDNLDKDQDLYDVIKSGSLACQYDLDEKKHNGQTQDDIRLQSSTPIQLLKRVSIANLVDFFSTGGRRRLIKSLFEQSELVEPTYEEVILIWRPLPEEAKKKRRDFKVPNYIYDIAEIFEVENRLPEKVKERPTPRPLEIRAFDRVPMANVLAVFPKTKLIFRPADAFIFDLINTTTFLAVLSSVRFDSPKLDVLALISGILWTLRTFFRYSNKLARYDLLVNKFLTKRISHRNAGAYKYVLSEASIQTARRASLVHEWLVQYVKTKEELKSNNSIQVLTKKDLLRDGIYEINQYYQSKEPIQLNLSAAFVDLEKLKLINFSNDDSELLLEVKDGKDAKDVLQHEWIDLLLDGE